MKSSGWRFAGISILALVHSAVLTLGACFDGFEATRLVDPLFVREVIPADSLVFDKGEQVDLSIRFNRAARLDELDIHIYPAPAAISPPQLSPTGHSVYFLNVEFDPSYSVHRLVIDGSAVHAPEIHSWWNDDADIAFVSGFVGSLNPSRTRNVDTLVFLLPLDTGFDPTQPSTFSSANPISVAIPRWSQTQRALAYSHTALMREEIFFVVAIADTDGSGTYDPSYDWWGAYGITDELFYLEGAIAGIGSVGGESSSHDFRLRPPN